MMMLQSNIHALLSKRLDSEFLGGSLGVHTAIPLIAADSRSSAAAHRRVSSYASQKLQDSVETPQSSNLMMYFPTLPNLVAEILDRHPYGIFGSIQPSTIISNNFS